MNSEYGKFAEVYDLLMRDVPYDAWTRYLLNLLSAGKINAGESIVDCACGTGEFAIRFAKAGFGIIGVDRSEQMLARAQEKARKAGLRIPFVHQDMRSLVLHKPVSAINCACDGVNYLLSSEEAEAFFRSANGALKRDGLLMFDLSSAYKLEKILGGHTFGEDLKECTYLWRNWYDPYSRLLEMQLAFFLPEASGCYTRFDERHVQYAHRIDDLISSLNKTGFQVEGVLEWPSMQNARPESERIQFVAKKIREL